jgi:hypothetical protein
MSVDVDEALCEGLLIVRVGVDDLVGVGRVCEGGCDENQSTG